MAERGCAPSWALATTAQTSHSVAHLWFPPTISRRGYRDFVARAKFTREKHRDGETNHGWSRNTPVSVYILEVWHKYLNLSLRRNTRRKTKKFSRDNGAVTCARFLNRESEREKERRQRQDTKTRSRMVFSCAPARYNALPEPTPLPLNARPSAGVGWGGMGPRKKPTRQSLIVRRAIYNDSSVSACVHYDSDSVTKGRQTAG